MSLNGAGLGSSEPVENALRLIRHRASSRRGSRDDHYRGLHTKTRLNCKLYACRVRA